MHSEGSIADMPAGPPQGPAASRRLAIYYALLVSGTVSLIGSHITGYAVSIAVFRETGQATPLGLIAFFSRNLVEGEVCVPYDRQQRRGEIFASCEVLGERYQDDGVVFRVRTHAAMLERLQAS